MLKVGGRTQRQRGLEPGTKELVRALGDVITLVEPRLMELWRFTGITFAQRRLLRRLVEGPRSPGDLASELGVSAPTLTRRLQKLETLGLLSRAMDPGDRRRVVVTLAEPGRRLLAGHRVLGGGPLVRAALALAPRERTRLAASLRELVRIAREQADGERDD